MLQLNFPLLAGTTGEAGMTKAIRATTVGSARTVPSDQPPSSIENQNYEALNNTDAARFNDDFKPLESNVTVVKNRFNVTNVPASATAKSRETKISKQS